MSDPGRPMRKPTARQLEAFRAVMVTGSMKRAAQMISVSQPAVSKIVKSLEEDLQIALFVRRKGGLVPSESALMLFEEVERSYIGLERIARTAEQLRERRAGRLRIAAMTAMSLDFLPRLMNRFLADRPEVSIALDTHNSPDVVEHVRNRHYDLGFTMTPIDRGGVEAGPVHRARCVCVLPAGHPLAKRRVVTAESLRGARFISLSEDSVTRIRIDHLFDSKGVDRDLKLSARSPASIGTFVRDGLGVALVDPFTAVQHAELGGVVRKFEPVIETPFVCVRPAGVDLTPLQADFLALFESAIKPYLA
jgi:DNA-binding transcriptional LysR family regulator